MTLWIIFAAMTAVAILAVLWPLGRKSFAPASGHDIAVYRDQLDEIGRDRDAGLIGPAEAEAARVELSRRLLAAADAVGAVTPAANVGAAARRRRVAGIAALVVVPLVAVSFYLALGSPDIPAQSAFARNAAP